MDGAVLVVRHGPGRGRIPDYLAGSLAVVRERRPEVHRRLRLHETGGPPPDLGDVRAVVFWLADPLREHYPECFAEAVRIRSEAEARGIAVVNPPEALSNSIKSVQQRLWREAGIPTPSHRRFESREELLDALPALDFPLFVRADEDHAQAGMYLCHGPEDARAISPERLALPGTATAFVDVREGFRRRSPAGLHASFFHKKRVLVLGEIVRPVHEFFSERPVVSKRTCTFRTMSRATIRRPWRYLRRARLAPTVQADCEYFWSDGGDPDLMRRAASALGLRFSAIDYASTADGGVVLWEANPHFSLPVWDQNLLPAERGLLERHRRLNDTLADFFRDLLEAG